MKMGRNGMSERKSVDWERIESDYRAGLLTLREMASVNDITEGAIRKRAKRDGWVRNLDAKIQAKAADLVREEAVREEVRKTGPLSEDAIVLRTATEVASVQISQRRTIARFTRLAIKLLEELEATTENNELFKELGEFLRDEDEKGVDKRNDLYHKVISMSGRISGMKQLGDTLKVLVALEREAYGMSNEAEKEKGAEGLATRIEAARKRAQS